MTSKAGKVARIRPTIDTGQRGEYAYSRLREDIRTGILGPSARLRETELASRLGVSRTPIREALKRLQTDGLIVFSPHGLVVAKLSPREVMEVYAMREVLEGAAARFAAERASRLEIESLKQIQAQQNSITNAAEAEQQNRRFHLAIQQAAHNKFLLDSMKAIQDAMSLLGTTTYAATGRVGIGWKEHAEIVDAIEKHDPDAAEAAAREHIRNASRAMLATMFGNDPPR